MTRTPKGTTFLASVGTMEHLTLSRGQNWPSHSCVVSLGASLAGWGLLGPLAEGAAHSCGLSVLGKQRGWHKGPFLWCPRPGKKLVEFFNCLSPSPWSVSCFGQFAEGQCVLEASLPQASTVRWPGPCFCCPNPQVGSSGACGMEYPQLIGMVAFPS